MAILFWGRTALAGRSISASGSGGVATTCSWRRTTDKEEILRGLLAERVAAEGGPSDWCYVFNFGESERPNLIRLPAGKASELASDMRGFVDEVRGSLTAAFESEQYQTRFHAIQELFQGEHESAPFKKSRRSITARP